MGSFPETYNDPNRQSGKAQAHEVKGHAAKDEKQIPASSM